MKILSAFMKLALCAAFTFTSLPTQSNAQTNPAKNANQIPELVQKDGRFALMVDGAPYLVLAGQANNSSNYPAMLPKVWEGIKDLNANTLIIPVAWEQIEPVENQFDFSYVDILVKQARENNTRIGILWFGTWKNTGASYTPSWVKNNTSRFPRLTNKDGSKSYALSPLYNSNLEADKKAYLALVNHIKKIDGERHTVIMLQVENEIGVYGAARDYSQQANDMMLQPVPAKLIKKMTKAALKPSGNWFEVFGDNADEYFHAWSMASYIEKISGAGKMVYPLPTYLNAALKDPFSDAKPGAYASGGPTYNVLDIYKVAAPSIDFISPDLYQSGSKFYETVLSQYNRPDNVLFVAETGNSPTYARYIFSVLGRQGIGFDPFGMDYTDYSNFPLGAKNWGPEGMKPFARVFKLFKGMDRVWAKLSFEGQVWGVSEPDDRSAQDLNLGKKWSAKVSYRQWQFGMAEWDAKHENGYPDGTETPSGGVVIAELSEDEFLVAGLNARITFNKAPTNKAFAMQLDRVEEGYFDKDGKWVFLRVWNGDQIDWGLNFTDKPTILKVKLSTY